MQVSVDRTRTLALAGMVAPVCFTALVIMQGWLQPDYSHVAMPISALAAWPSGWIQVLNFYTAGLLKIAFAYGLHTDIAPTRRGIAGFLLLVASGIGLILAGRFSWYMVDGVPTETPGHVVGAILSFAATGLGFIVLSRRMSADPRWHDLATYTLLTGVSVLVLFVVVGFFAVDDGTPFHPWAGLLQRVLCAVWFACLLVLAFRLYRHGLESSLLRRRMVR